MANSLAVLSATAVLAIYAAGYFRTRSAAERFEVAAALRRTVIPDAARVAPIAPAQPHTEVKKVVAQPVTMETSIQPANDPAPAAPTSSVPKSVSAPPLATGSPRPATKPKMAPAAPVLAPVDVSTTQVPVEPAAPTSSPMVVEGDQKSAEPAAAAIRGPITYKDGTYTGWGYCRHGGIEASVVVVDGRIASAEISQCLTRYPCSYIEQLPPQVAARQSPEVDWVSGATESADAFYYALVAALTQAK